MVKVPVLVLAYPGFRSDCYSPCIGNACRFFFVRELTSLLSGRIRWVVGSLGGRGWSFR